MKDKIKLTEIFVKKSISEYDSGHDWWHIERVRKLASFINSKENLADPFILETAVLLHDVVDSKFNADNQEDGYSDVHNFLTDIGLSDIANRIIEVIKNVSFSKKNPSGNLSDPVLLILQDADKLDAIGAIGIARAFNYGGFRNNAIYIPDEKPMGNSKSTIGHFYDKLLKLKDMMNTGTARIIAEERHAVLEEFLDHFYKEWDLGA